VPKFVDGDVGQDSSLRSTARRSAAWKARSIFYAVAGGARGRLLSITWILQISRLVPARVDVAQSFATASWILAGFGVTDARQRD